MIKLVVFAVAPVLAASFFAQKEAQKEPPPPKLVDQTQLASADADEDRSIIQTLATLEKRDKAFLDRSDAGGIQPVAAHHNQEMPVRRAIPVASGVPAPVTTAPPVTRNPGFINGQEVRRAVPVKSASADRRNALNQSYVTLMEPETRPTRSPTAQTRASMLIYSDRVVVRSQP